MLPKVPRMYKWFFRHFLTKLDTETAHHLGMSVIRVVGWPGVRSIVGRSTKPATNIAVTAMGLQFASPFGLAAGFDKNAIGVRGLSALGFGHVEVGTLTNVAQPGNPKPRLFRLVEDHAVINRMGFNNDGAAAAAKRLAKLRKNNPDVVIGVNVGKSRVVEVADAVDDYVAATKAVARYADYLAINVSSPNTPGLRGLQDATALQPLLHAVKATAGDVPVAVKIAPDLTDAEIIEIAELAVREGMSAIIATNTTISRDGLKTSPDRVAEIGAGGLSGAPLKQRSLDVLRVIRSAVPEDFCVISVGGVTTAADVAERLANGATLVQGYTAFLYEGPLWARTVNKKLRKAAAAS